MNYPHGFPMHLRTEVEKVIARAEIRLSKLRKVPSYDPARDDEKLLLDFVDSVVESFASQAREALRAATWDGPQMRNAIEQFIPETALRIYARKHPNARKYESAGLFQMESRRQSENSTWWATHQRKLGKILDGPKQPRKPAKESRADTRNKVVMPLLQKKGFSPNGWATKAGLHPSIVYNYLKGQTTLRPASRNELATALGIQGSDLPQ
jgi:hypothetical protein